MTNSHILLKNVIKTRFFNWVNDCFSGSMGTRHARVKYVFNRESKKLFVEVRFDKIGYSSLMDQKLKNYYTPVNKTQTHGHQTSRMAALCIDHSEISSDFNGESSLLIFNDMIRNLWNSTCLLSLDKSRGSDYGEILSSFQFLRNRGTSSDKMIVEFGSPNIAKPLHLGHFRSTMTGNFIARICKAANNDVLNFCLLGDFGKQFGILQAGLSHWNPEENTTKTAERMDLESLLQCYISAVKQKETDEEFAKKAHGCCAALERGDSEAVQVWSSVREKTVNHLREFWAILGVHYDVIQGESEFTVTSDHMEKVLRKLKENNVLETASDGCIYAILPAEGNLAKVRVPIVKADGSSLYLTRDMACALARLEQFRFDRMIYVVDKTQANHFILLFRLLEKLGLLDNSHHDDKWENTLRHVKFGKVEGMSTRSGNFVLLSDVIRYGSVLMEENRKMSPNTRLKNDDTIATQLALSAIVVNSLKVRRNRDVRFDWHEALRPTGETGIRLQYTHARLCSLEAKLATFMAMNQSVDLPSEFDMEYVLNDAVATDLFLHLVNFEDAFWSSYSELEPCVLLTYLFKLCDKVSKGLKELKVQTEPNKSTAITRYTLFCLSRRILTFSMNVIGVRPLHEM